jgi:hypothetical protein
MQPRSEFVSKNLKDLLLPALSRITAEDPKGAIKIAVLSKHEKQRIHSWLELFNRDCDPSTTEILTSCSIWPMAAKIFSGYSSWGNPFFDQLETLRNTCPNQYLDPELHLISTSLGQKGQTRLLRLLESNQIFIDGICLRFIECLRRFNTTDIVSAIKKLKMLELEKKNIKGASIGSLSDLSWYFADDASEDSLSAQLKSSANAVWENVVRIVERKL